MECLYVSAVSCAVLLDRTGHYEASVPCRLTLNGREIGEERRSVVSLFGLLPDTEYTLTVKREEGQAEEIRFRTKAESCALDVRRFGAKGDGETEDTAALQAAILCCPEGGRVIIPAGNYVTGPLFLKSHITLEWEKGAVLSLLTDRNAYPVLPGAVACANGEYLLGSWEGSPQDSFAAALNGIGVEDVHLIGEGIVDGRAQAGDWWIEPKKIRVACRGRMLFLRHCQNVTVQGLTFRNSPAWNLHPMFSQDLSFLNVRVEAPADSPNTDGIDPESCKNVRILGTVFSVGDDCIAIKSGKIYMGNTYHTPCENLEIAWCHMLRGHGGVTIGSEMSGGVRHVRVHHCLMEGSDRGLRVKTRRGRGKWGVVDDIRFEDVRMDGVSAPLVVNALYYCDPDGRTPYVQSREKQRVDDTTPTLGRVCFERVEARNCQSCAGYILGLPERPAEEIAVRSCVFSFSPSARPMVPAMADGVEECLRRGIIAHFVKELIVENTRFEGVEGPWVQREEEQ